LQWQFGISMDKPKDVSARGVCPGIHLSRPIPFAANDPITEACSKINRSIGTSPIGYNNLGSGRSLPQVREKPSYQRGLVENRNND
jgi:hypothetical protein